MARGGKREGAGRKPGALSAAKKSLRDLARVHVPTVLKELARLATKAESEQARVSAIKEILDRSYGKAPQPMTGEEGEGPVELVVTWQFKGS